MNCSLSRDEYREELCRRCGRCCYQKYIVNGTVFVTSRPCKYLDVKTNLCTIYAKRHELNPRCLDVPTGIRMSVFPADCPYVADLEDYQPPFEIPLDDATLRLVTAGRLRDPEEIRRHLMARAGQKSLTTRTKEAG